MGTLPTVSVSTIITNPFSSHYYTYLAFLESWAKVVDEIILVDGGSTDNSLEVAKNWVSGSAWSKVRIINNEETFWDQGESWHALQAMNNYYTGLCASTCDWVITINADCVLYPQTALNLRQSLADNNDIDVLFFYRSKLKESGMQHRIDARSTIINYKRIKDRALPLAFGVKTGTFNGFDFSIIASHKTMFSDPVSGKTKRILAGTPYPKTRVIDMECAVFGHFFFDEATLLKKLHRWDRVFSRYLGLAPRRDAELTLLKALYGIKSYQTKAQVLGYDCPEEVLRLIDQFYQPGMWGGAVRNSSVLKEMFVKTFRKTLAAERHYRTHMMRSKGYRGLRDMHKWVKLDEPDPEPLDIAGAYLQQDYFFPDWAKSSDFEKNV